MAIKFIDLCSGIGGFHSGLTATGHYECVGHAEIDPHASKAYAAIYGKEGGLNYGDLRKIKPKKLPDFDLLCAGFPCQSFSVAGRRLGFKDTRGTIFFEIARIIAEKRPSFILLENVPYAQKHIRYILKHEICRVFRCKYSGNFKEESSPWIVESPSCSGRAEGDARETADKKVEIRDFIGVDCSCVITEIFSFRWV